MRLKAVVMMLDNAPKTWGTREEFHLRLSRGLVNRGRLPILVFADNLPDALTNRFQDIGAKVSPINYRAGIRNYYRELGRLTSAYDVDVAHIRFFDYFSFLPWLARLNGVRRIIFTEANSGDLRATSWRKHLLWLRTQVMTKPLTQAIAISGFVKQRLIAVGIAPEKVHVVYNGVDVERFRSDPDARERLSRELPIGPNDIIVSTASVLVEWKHPETIVKACALLHDRGIPVRLLIAGTGAMRSGLEQLAKGQGIGERVHFLGHHPDPEQILQASDVFVLASVSEAFGNVLGEAMACCVPVVGTRSGAIPEIIEHGHTGFLAEPEDEASFADALEKLANDENLRRIMGQRGREKVYAEFTVDQAVSKTLALYESLWDR
jgi:glycosyltransferase involved in cell wall biosynthesis